MSTSLKEKTRISQGELIDSSEWKGKTPENNILFLCHLNSNIGPCLMNLIPKFKIPEVKELGGFYSDNGTPIKFWGTREDYIKLKLIEL